MSVRAVRGGLGVWSPCEDRRARSREDRPILGPQGFDLVTVTNRR